MAKHAFEKFINKVAKGAKKKELIKQQKRKSKAEARVTGEERRRKKYEIRTTKLETRNQKLQVRNQKNPILNKQEKENPPFVGTNGKRQTPNTKRETRNEKPLTSNIEHPTSNFPMPLNKFIAHAGVCARREAAELVKQGLVVVNDNKILEPGYKVSPGAKVLVKGKQVFQQKNLVHILLNKPKDYLTTANDPHGRKTVFDIIKHATNERVFSVGRLDRNTTGVLLLTNDGELAQKLTHPSYEVKKIYEVSLDKPLTKKDFEAILNGIHLEDGFIAADAIAYIDIKDKSLIGIEVHSGRNRIVRRMFEHLGYQIKTLDRVMFANLTKKNVERGKWRFLNEREIRLLKYMNQSFIRKSSAQPK